MVIFQMKLTLKNLLKLKFIKHILNNKKHFELQKTNKKNVNFDKCKPLQ